MISTPAATAASLFVGTNIDDLVVLAVLSLSSRVAGRPAVWQIWLGQYAGITVLVGVAMLAALGLTAMPSGWIWPLGLLPLGLGLRKLAEAVRAHRCGRPSSPAPATGLVGVMITTIANGGDNVAAYVPLFRADAEGDLAVTVIIFAVGVAVWCMAGFWLASHGCVTRLIERWGQWIIPMMYILIGTYIFHKAGALGT
jgi:cadmium resistance protein CadD (predicted permease)